MGLPAQILLMLLNEHKLRPLEQPVLTLGKQELPCSYKKMLETFEATGITPQPLPPGMPTGHFEVVGKPGQTNDVAFFAHLGIRVLSMDYSTFEGADIAWDLNNPIPDELRGKFRTIIDAGTTEHVFDVRQALGNISELLEPGGRVIHINPINNYVNHGFWQFSPTMYYDFYETNGFKDLHANLVIHHRDDAHLRPMAMFAYDPEEHFGTQNFYSGVDNMMGIFFVATKTEASTSNKIPIQAWYRKAHLGARVNPSQYYFTTKGESFEVDVKQLV